MFFRREKPKEITYSDHVQSLTPLGFVAETVGGVLTVRRNGCGAVIEKGSDGQPVMTRIGLQMGQEIGILVDAGFQKFFTTDSNKRLPATAAHLKALHAFEEDLREGLGLVSLYNESLGATNTSHMYDRVRDRDKDQPKKPWEVRL